MKNVEQTVNVLAAKAMQRIFKQIIDSVEEVRMPTKLHFTFMSNLATNLLGYVMADLKPEARTGYVQEIIQHALTVATAYDEEEEEKGSGDTCH